MDRPIITLRCGRALADRRLLHDQPRRQDRGRGGGRRTYRRPPSRPRRMRALSRATARRSTAWSAAIEAMRRRDRPRPRPRRACSRRCRRARRAMRSTARSGIWRPSAPAARRTSLPAWPRRSRSPPPTRSRWAAPDAMAEAAAKAAERALLKIKLGGDGDPARIAAVRRAAPDAELIVDANEGWTADDLDGNLAACAAGRRDAGRAAAARRARRCARARSRRPVPVCADESAHDARLARGARRQIRRGQHQARQDRRADRGAGHGRRTPNGSASTSWSAAWWRPRSPWRRRCWSRNARRVVDLDGPLLLARDRPDGLRYEGSLVHPPTAALWG